MKSADNLREIYDMLRKTSEVRKTVKDHSFVTDIEWNPENACNYLEILGTVFKTFDPALPLDDCKIEAFKSIYAIYKDYVDVWNDDNSERTLKINKEMQERWNNAVKEKISRDALTIDEKADIYNCAFDPLCAIVYKAIFEDEIVLLLALRNTCKQKGIILPDFETLVLEAYTAIYDYYKWYVTEVVYTDGDFYTEECQEFFDKWRNAIGY